MNLHRIRRGLDLPLAGAPSQRIEPARPVSRVALLGDDTIGLKPSLQVQPGDRVRRGQWLFEDKKNPGVGFVAPASGTVSAIHRGERRAFQSLVIEVGEQDGEDDQLPFAHWHSRPAAEWSAAQVRALLLESGLWTALRTRPFSRVPAPDSQPYALYITAIDTRPHAPSVATVMAGREADFEAGVAALSRLCEGKTHVCVAPGFAPELPPLAAVAHQVFDGPHPAGNAGTHIHWLSPVDLTRCVWHIGCQDVMAVGYLLRTGRLDVQRVIALAGPSVARPRLLRTRLGAGTDELIRDELLPGSHRAVSGSLLDGRTAMGEAQAYLGRYHQQLSVLAEAGEREFFGWIAPGRDKFSLWGVVLGAWWRSAPLALTTTTNGGSRAMVPIGAFERVMPLDLMPTFLLRALLVSDDERAELLGALELDEEDLALCTFVCPGKAEYGPLLRAALARIEKEAA